MNEGQNDQDVGRELDYILEKSKKHNPTLRNFVQVEKLIFENKEFETKRELYNLLPKGMQYPTFNFILDVLEKQNKIMFDKDGSFFGLDLQAKN